MLDTALSDVKLLEPTIHRDSRGIFVESYNSRNFSGVVGQDLNFVQDNFSSSVEGTLRGLHYQAYPHAQGKLVQVLRGTVFDVVVDIRPSSPQFGQWLGLHLSCEEMCALWIPEGYAHGFLVTSASADVFYKVTDYWSPAYERSLAWNCPTLAIDWPIAVAPILSDKDRIAPFFDEMKASK